MTTSDDCVQRADEIMQEKRSLIVSAQTMHESGRSNTWIAKALNISESEVRKLVINWGYNCLTSGVHHGRPEAIWNIPLLYAATEVFRRDVLQELVISRIYNDAMQIVEHSDKTLEWADRVKELAEERFNRVLQVKIGQISKYYKAPEYQLEIERSIQRLNEGKLNSHYQPLHDHDTINMLCRIIGVSADMQATREQQ